MTKIPFLSWLKVIGIILIVAFHYFGQLSGWHMHLETFTYLQSYFATFSWDKLINFIKSYFFLGVNIFVIASGCGLTLSRLRHHEHRWHHFLYKRLNKIIPGAILAIIFLFLFRGLLLWGWPTANWWRNFFPFLIGLNLFSDQWFFPPINGETWFLGLIIQLYLLFPLLYYALQRWGVTRFLWGTFLVSVIFRIFYVLLWADTVSTLSYGFSLGRVFEFGWGMVLAQKIFNKEPWSLWPWVTGLLLFGGYFFPWAVPFTDSLLGVGVTSLFILLTFQTKHSALVDRLADLSYLVFLLHHPFIWYLYETGPLRTISTNSPAGILLFLPFVVVMFVVAWGGEKIISFSSLINLRKNRNN